MKSAYAFLATVLAVAAWGKDEPILAGPIELHGEHAVLVAGSQSADGHFAVGWTVQPKEGQPPVKWESYGKENGSFLEDYCDNDGYELTNLVIDLAHRTVAATLPFTNPYFTHKGHGALEAVFGQQRNGHRFAIVLTAAKWSATDVVLVDLTESGAVFADILNSLDAGVDQYIGGQTAGQQRLDPKIYATQYRLSGLPDMGLLTGFSDANTVRIPFSSEVPKKEEARYITGTIVLRLSRGKSEPQVVVGEVREFKGEPDPTQDALEVVAADKELNAAYTAAKNAANAAGKAKLLEEQRAWIKERDEKVAAARKKGQEEGSVANSRLEADRVLAELTRERASKLRGK